MNTESSLTISDYEEVLSTQRDELLVALKELKKYATHKRSCAAVNINKSGLNCDCGYQQAIKMAEQSQCNKFSEQS